MLDITNHVRAGYPAIAIETFEDRRFCEQLQAQFPKRGIYTVAAGGPVRDFKTKAILDKGAHGAAFQLIQDKRESFLVALDFQHIVNNPQAYRMLLDSLEHIKKIGTMIILLAPSWNLPAEMQHEVPVLHDSLPSTSELSIALDIIQESTGKIADDVRTALTGAARGLTVNEAENAFALAAIQTKKFSSGVEQGPQAVETEKLRLVKSKCMSVEKPRPINDLGGLANLKDWFINEVIPAKDDEQLRVRGSILVGVPGSGKSLAARVAASIMSQPLVRLDVAAAKGSLVGESEATLRRALDIVDAIAPCVLWVDEIEKAVGGYSSSANTDGGTTLGMVGALLTWMQEHTSPVIVIATCNDFHKLPPELTRAGRMDARWFLDLPPENERREIAAIHLRKLGIDTGGKLPLLVAEKTKGFTGAEIEDVIKTAARRTSRNITGTAIQLAIDGIIPISKSADIQGLRDWAKTNLRQANGAEVSDPAPARRIQ